MGQAQGSQGGGMGEEQTPQFKLMVPMTGKEAESYGFYNHPHAFPLAPRKFNAQKGEWLPPKSSERHKDVSNPLQQELSIITWNIWFSPYEDINRAKGLFKVIEEYNFPDIVCLQEVRHEPFLELLKQQQWCRDKYWLSTISSDAIGSYGVIILSKIPNPCRLTYYSLPSRLGRACKVADFQFSTDQKEGKEGEEEDESKSKSQSEKNSESNSNSFISFTIGTVHLESLDGDGPVRAKQLKCIHSVLSEKERNERGSVMLVGDYNLNAYSTENEELLNILKPEEGWEDVWNTLHTDPEDKGITVDSKQNIMLKRSNERRGISTTKVARIDRVFMRRNKVWKPVEIEVLGTKEFMTSEWKGEKLPVYVSDHFGLYIKIKLED